MPAGIFKKLLGTINSAFQLGLGGPQLNSNGSAIESKNAANSGFVVHRGATPVGDNDFVTKLYADTLASRTVVAQQFNGGSALPSNSGTEQFYVVTTSGAQATVGQLLWDDGSGSGTVTVLAAASRLIITAAAFSGGTITFKADSLYFWDTTSTSWVNAGGSQTSGTIREIRFAVTNAASQSSANAIPANAFIFDCKLIVSTPYSAGATIAIGQTGTTALLQATTDNLPQTAGTYDVEGDTAWGASALAVLVTIAGAPAAGAGTVAVLYAVPDN